MRLDKAESLSRIAAIMACADTHRQNATSSMAGLLPALLAVAVVAEPDADEAADVAHTATGAVAVVDVDVDAAEVAVADKHPPTLRESPTTETTATPSRFWPQRRSTTTTSSSDANAIDTAGRADGNHKGSNDGVPEDDTCHSTLMKSWSAFVCPSRRAATYDSLSARTRDANGSRPTR